MMFSSRVQESVVQLVEPHQSAAPSRTRYLWCMRSGSPGIAFSGTPSSARMSGRVLGGGGHGDLEKSVCVERDPHRDAARMGRAKGGGDAVSDRAGQTN